MGSCQCKQQYAEPQQVVVHKTSRSTTQKEETQNGKGIVLFKHGNPRAKPDVQSQVRELEEKFIEQSNTLDPPNRDSLNSNHDHVENKETTSMIKVQPNNREVIEERNHKAIYEEKTTKKEVEVEKKRVPSGNRKQSDRNYYDDQEKDDDSFGYEYDENGYGDGEDEQDIEIENTYFEADDKKNSNPKAALEGFQTVIMMEETRPERKYTFKSLLNIILIKCKLKLFEELLKDVSKILKEIDNVSKNDSSDAINSILETLVSLENNKHSERIIVTILESLKQKNFEQLWLNTGIKLCKIYLDRKDYTQFQKLLDSLKESCRLPNGTDDPKKSSTLLEIYSLEIHLHMQTMNFAKMREIYEKTKNISSAIADPRTMGIIRETQGKILMIERKWEEARLELFEAFKYYQEVGSGKAKGILKYVILVSILSQSSLNPFDNVEAKVYRDDNEIKILDNLRTAYEEKNEKELTRIVSSYKNKIFDEPFIKQFEEDFMNVIALDMIVTISAPYKRLKFEYIQKELNLSAKQVENYISRLILDKRLNGRIDLIEGFFENYNARRNSIEDKKNEALYQWINSFSKANI